MIRPEYPQPQQKSHKQVIWDLQALSCFHVAEEECSGSLAHTHAHTDMALTPPLPLTHACMYQQTWAQNMNKSLCMPADQLHTLPSRARLLPFYSSPLLSCTLRQLSAELLRKQAGKQAYQQQGRGTVSLMSSKAVSKHQQSHEELYLHRCLPSLNPLCLERSPLRYIE